VPNPVSDGPTPRPPATPGKGGPAAYRRRILAALQWNVSGEAAAQGMRFAFGIWLARLLTPRAFGLMAILMILVQVLLANADLGFEEALIQRRDVREAHRSSVFWALLLPGLGLGAVQVAVAPWLARFFDVGELAPLATGLSVVYLLRVVGTVPRAIVARDLDFRIVASRRCAAVGLAGACAVVMAWRGWGVTSLAAEVVLSTGLESVLLLRASRWRPRLELRLAALRELAGFGAYRPVTGALNYWAQRLDQLLIGKLIGSNSLGLYARVFNVTRFPVVSVARVFVNVVFPSLSGIQDDAAHVRDVYLRTTGAVALAAVPIAMGLWAAAEPFVLGVLGPQWRGAIPILRILALGGLFDSLIVFSTGLYLAQGRADLVLWLTVAQRAFTIVAVVIGLAWGVLGVATAQLLAAAVGVLPMLLFAGRLVDLPLRTVLARLAPVVAAGMVMAATVAGVGRWAAPGHGMVSLLGLEVVVGAASYWTVLHLLAASAYRDLMAAIGSAIRPGASA
jgi:O-antigen/teichoic acid export membrane protein